MLLCGTVVDDYVELFNKSDTPWSGAWNMYSESVGHHVL